MQEEFDLPPLAPRPESMAGSRPATPVSNQNRPHTPTTPVDRGRTLSPTPSQPRSRSSSPLPKRKTSKVAPTDQPVPSADEGKSNQHEKRHSWLN